MHVNQATFVALAAFFTQTLAHGVVTSITGANGVTMPGLSVIDGTPRDCASPLCGAEADTSIIRKNGASPLGKTNGGGQVNAASAISSFMGAAAGSANTSGTAATANTGNSAGTGNTAATAAGTNTAKRTDSKGNKRRGLLDALTGGGKAGGAAAGGAATATGTKTAKGTVEGGVSKAAGAGASSGLPTVGDDGVINMTFHQVNQDGAGPLTAAVDPTSGGTDAAAFQPAQMVQDVPGAGIGGLSAATTTDFPIKVQMPAGMKCTGSVGGASNVCVVKVQNSALAGPFGGSAAFTQSAAAQKRAEEYIRLKSKRFADSLE